MGETSKTSGEIGESLANSLLNKIGWRNHVRNISIPCGNRKHINENGKMRQTHGEDQVYTYQNPFHDDWTEVVHISNKNNQDSYPSGQSLKTKFKSHVKELVETIECAESSAEIAAILGEVKNRSNTRHSGLLMWFQNDNDLERDIRSELANARIEAYGETPIYIIDNARAAFLVKVVNSAKACDENFLFYYPRIGTYYPVDTNRNGTRLPLELISSDIIPVLINRDNSKEMIIYANTSYSKDTYRRLVGYGLSFADGLLSKIKIGLPDYNPVHHKQEVDEVQLGFDGRSEVVEAFSYNDTILSLLGGK